MKSYVIHFIRHGAIDETLSGKYIGTTDVELSDKGKAALRKLDFECDYPYAKVVFTSPLKRCTQTCKILYPELDPLVIANLSECNFGEWEGKTADELKDDPDFQKWLAGDNSVKPPRGESNADFVRRKPFEWAMENGCGYSIRITPMLWQRDKVTEVYQQIPVAAATPQNE